MFKPLFLIGAGVVPTFVDVVAQVSDDTGGAAAPWVQLGGIAASMSALAYVAKRFADGSIVARPVADMQDASARREERFAELLEDANQREDAHRALLMAKRMEGT